MKREIKFRFWDKDLKKMFYRKTAYNDFSHPSIIPMQFTGLKNNSGVDIYEGDILEFPFEMGIAFVINDGFRFAVESPGSGAVDYENEDVYKATSVIGNIYENPELLNGVISADA